MQCLCYLPIRIWQAVLVCIYLNQEKFIHMSLTRIFFTIFTEGLECENFYVWHHEGRKEKKEIIVREAARQRVKNY